MPKKTIMVVDDEYEIAKAVQEILKNKGYDVITASSGADALTTLKKTKVDLVLTDVLMPGMSGIELTKKIREDEKLKNLKIAFLTVVNFSKDQLKNLKKLNVSDYLQKPFDTEDLVKRIKKIIEEQ